jgi:putative transposase
MGAAGPLLAYKIARYGGLLTVADRWDGTACRLVGNGKVDKQLVCPSTGVAVDRDINAARNLRDWPDHASCGPVGATAPSVPGPTKPTVGTGHGADAGTPGAGGASVRPHSGGAGSGEAKSQTPQGDAA